jgi:hypothetical protein
LGHLLFYAALAMVFGTAGLAVWKGSQAERFGVIIYFAIWALEAVASGAADHYPLIYAYFKLSSDLLIAAGFLMLALRYSSLWLAGAMIAQGLCAATHAFHLEDDQAQNPLVWHGLSVWLLSNNIFTTAVFWLLLGGTIASWRRRAKGRREARATPAIAAAA